jgi:hypothetical protein
MAFDLGGSESKTDNKTTTVNRQVAASDQAVVNQPRNSGNNRTNIKLGNNSSFSDNDSQGNLSASGGSTITQYYGLGADDIIRAQGELARSLTGALSRQDSPIDNAVEQRAANQIDSGGEEAANQIEGGLSKTNWAIIIVGAVILLGLGLYKMSRRK